MQRRAPLRRGKRPNRKGAKAAREAPALAAFRLELKSRGWCEASGIRWEGAPVCGSTRTHHGEHPHHVYPEDRDRGIHDPARGLWLCPAAHDWAHANPEAAKHVRLLRPDPA